MIDATMAAAFPPYDDQVRAFYRMLEYQLGWRNECLQRQVATSGKLIRPRLCLLACRLVGGDERRALPVAAAVELLHNFTLVHDDIQDQSPLRRGRPTVWYLWGAVQGITVGDALCAVCHRALYQLVDAGVAAELALHIARHFDDTLLRITEGQYLDVAFEDRLDLTEADYLAMIERKTATLIAGALTMGALAGGGMRAAGRALAAYGRALGLAYQIQDDLLGIWGDPTVTGKPVHEDLYRRKKSLPVVYALAHAERQDQARLHAIYGSRADINERDIEQLLAILERVGAHHYAEQRAEHYHAAAIAALNEVAGGDHAARMELRNVADSLQRRAQ